MTHVACVLLHLQRLNEFVGFVKRLLGSALSPTLTLWLLTRICELHKHYKLTTLRLFNLEQR
jgi:small-conductance mechanosensitive channel